MKFGKSPPFVTDKPRGFYELAKAHVETHGGQLFVVERNTRPFRAWIAYFAWLDDQTHPKGGRARAFGRLGCLTHTGSPQSYGQAQPYRTASRI